MSIDKDIFIFAYKMAFRDAMMRKAFPKNEGEGETNFKAVKKKIYDVCRPVVEKYINDIFREEYPEPKDVILSICSICNEERFSFGNAQKLVNMTAKYMFLSSYHDDNKRKLFEKCHCPMDSFMIQKVPQNLEKKFIHSMAWSKIVVLDTQAYDYFQEEIRKQCNDCYPIEYDFLEWDS